MRAAFAAVGKEAAAFAASSTMPAFTATREAHELATDDFDDLMRTNAPSVMMVCREAYPHLEKRRRHRIVNIGSFFDKIGVTRNLAYCASKAAVGAITRCLAVEWARDEHPRDERGARLHRDRPQPRQRDDEEAAALDQARLPAGRPGTPEEVARLVASLFSEDIAFLTGETIYIDGGQAMAL